MDDYFGHVHSGKRCIEGEIQLVKISRLAVAEPSELLSVPVAELYLETGSVVFHDGFCRHVDVCREIKDWLPFVGMEYDQTDVPLERTGIHHGCEECAFALEDVDPFELVHVGVLGIHLTIELSGPALPARLATIVKVHHGCIATKSADDVEALLGKAVHEIEYGEVGVRHDVSGKLQELLLVGKDAYQIPLGQADAAFCQRLGGGGLHGFQRDAFLAVDVNQPYAQYLQPVLDGLGAPRPEGADTLSVLPGLGNVAWIYGYGLAVRREEQVLAELYVEVDPFEMLGKVVSIGLFAVISVDFELSKIHLAGQ